MSERDVADEVLRHSEDAGEWDQEPVEIERRPSGSHVISARIPESLAARLFAHIEEHGIRLSEVMREALEFYLRDQPPATVEWWDVVVIQPGFRVRVLRDEIGYETENPVVTEQEPALHFPPPMVALG